MNHIRQRNDEAILAELSSMEKSAQKKHIAAGDDKFKEQAEALANFVRETKRWPKQKATAPVERKVAKWISYLSQNVTNAVRREIIRQTLTQLAELIEVNEEAQLLLNNL